MAKEAVYCPVEQPPRDHELNLLMAMPNERPVPRRCSLDRIHVGTVPVPGEVPCIQPETMSGSLPLNVNDPASTSTDSSAGWCTGREHPRHPSSRRGNRTPRLQAGSTPPRSRDSVPSVPPNATDESTSMPSTPSLMSQSNTRSSIAVPGCAMNERPPASATSRIASRGAIWYFSYAGLPKPRYRRTLPGSSGKPFLDQRRGDMRSARWNRGPPGQVPLRRERDVQLMQSPDDPLRPVIRSVRNNVRYSCRFRFSRSMK